MATVLPLKPVSVKTNGGQMHLSAADHVGAAVLAHVVRTKGIEKCLGTIGKPQLQKIW